MFEKPIFLDGRNPNYYAPYGPAKCLRQMGIIDTFSRSTVKVEVRIGDKFGNGSGLIVDDKGTVLTCFHVVRPHGLQPDELRVIDSTGTHMTQIVRVDQYRDVALLRTEGL